VTKKLRWGILGTARIAVTQVVPAIQQSLRGAVVAVASRDDVRARSVASALGIPAAYGAYEALLASSEVDAVYIPLPNHLHAEWTIAAARAGKHVLCEKPLALNAAQAQEMVDAAERAGVTLMEAFMYRFHPTWLKVRDLIATGAIGEVRCIHSWFSYRNEDPRNIRNIPRYGGGALMDIGCYPVSVARMIFGGQPTAIHAASRRHPQFGTDMLTTALLEFGDRHATFTCSTVAEPSQSVRVLGTTGAIDVPIPYNIPHDLRTEVHLIAGGNPPVAPGMTPFTFAPANQYGLQTDAFAEAVLDGRPLTPGPRDAIDNMSVIDAIRNVCGGDACGDGAGKIGGLAAAV
jgi:predicted dehydrogenase